MVEMISNHNFGPASPDEQIVFGAERPGYRSEQVGLNSIKEWISFMKNKGIKRVCCLLPEEQLKYYGTNDQFLLDIYRKEFGEDNVCTAPITDYELCDISLLKEIILPFLQSSDGRGEKVVVHCSGGIGRTARILAAWLVYKYNVSPEEAITIIRNQNSVNRKPYEGLRHRNDLLEQLAECRINPPEIQYKRKEKLLTGISVSKRSVNGFVRNVAELDPKLMAEIKTGEIIVARDSWYHFFEYLPLWQMASAWIFDEGNITCSAAMSGRDLKIPTLIKTVVGTKLLKTGQEILVDGAEGAVYSITHETDDDS
jgi:protein-tyrosine phosphatase/phosphohistidine swiveling domain-containing protein